MRRLLLVSNRLPIQVSPENGRSVVTPSPGGLATGLWEPHERSEGLWFGWRGDLAGLDRSQRDQVQREFSRLRLVPLRLTRREVRAYYDEFSNGVLWPLFHYLLDHIPLVPSGWPVYRAVNERFARLVAEQYRPGDLIWVHDFHLTLLPALLRKMIPGARIGFFLHIPFPASEIFRLLPQREEVLEGLLGADLIGFHTPTYARHFASALTRFLGLEVDVGRIWYNGRIVQTDAFPMGIAADTFEETASRPGADEAVLTLKKEYGDARLLLGVDRMDYTKGILRRLLAFEHFLRTEPELGKQVSLVQVAVPSRLQVRAYRSIRKRIEALVGRINGSHTVFGFTPVHYISRSLTHEELAIFYRAADVMLVTALRDGMNLVAKEYVASRVDEDGVLILSEFAGASSQLPEAIRINPYDIEGVAAAIKTAMEMPQEERSLRMRKLRECVLKETVHDWAARFLEALETAGPPVGGSPADLPVSAPEALDDLLRGIRLAPRVNLILDYDGTLRGFEEDPDDAAPDPELMEILEKLTGRPGVSIHIVTGRKREQIERWFGSLPAGLHAEHGLWFRSSQEHVWMASRRVPLEWKDRVRPILQEFARRTPGAFVEEKDASLVWHYRKADPEFGSIQARELRVHLLESLSNLPVQIMGGARIVEVRAYGIDKGSVVNRIVGRPEGASLIVAMGDDRTDEDLFAALPPGGIGIHVGPNPSLAPYRLADPGSARAFLAGIVR